MLSISSILWPLYLLSVNIKSTWTDGKSAIAVTEVPTNPRYSPSKDNTYKTDLDFLTFYIFAL